MRELDAVLIAFREGTKCDAAVWAMREKDPESPTLKRLLSDATRRDYVSAFAEWRSDMAHRWRAAGASYAQVIADEDPSHAVRRIAEPSGGSAQRR